MQLAELFPNRIALPEPGTPLDRTMLPGGGGVCALTAADGTVILTLSAASLRRALALRLDPPPEATRRARADLRAIARHIWWTKTHSAFETSLAYLRIARRLAPCTYRKDLAFGPTWFARVDPTDEYPRWVCDKFAFTPPVVDVGPFQTRQSCRRFIELLEDLFDLCRYHDVLRQSPNGQACAYKDMGKCPAPCDGTITLDEYRPSIRAAIEFATGASDTRLAQLDEKMREASAARQFEQAARLREQIAAAKKVLAANGRIQPIPENFRYLSIQQGAGKRRIKPFFIDRGFLEQGEPLHLHDIEQAATQWADKTWSQKSVTASSSAHERSEHVWLVCHFLNKSSRSAGLFLHADELVTPENIVARVRERFCRAPTADAGAVAPVDHDDPSQLE